MKNSVLLFSSLLFYAWGEKLLVFMFMGTILAGWILGLLIEKYRKTGLSGLFLTAALGICLGTLGYFKYADFFIENVNRVTGLSIPLLKVSLPIGISFYTFQIISYLLDVYGGRVTAQKNLIDFAAYVALFPQLIAGPIVRYLDIAVQLKERTHSLPQIASGVRRFLMGLGKKVLIANVIGEVCVRYRMTTDGSVLYCWLYAAAFLLQIYYDFSGYSDMAIGLGRMFGFEFAENFNYPYISGSITEFWRRWHISLGTWFRDYVYIPLGGNRKGRGRQLLNILIVWLLTGLWHGAAWNFVLWGFLFAVLLVIEKAGLLPWLKRHPVISHSYVLFMILLGFLLFNADSLRQAGSDMAGLFGMTEGLPLWSGEALYYLRSYAVVYLIGIAGATPIPRRAMESVRSRMGRGIFDGVISPLYGTLILLAVTAYLVDGSFNPFLYFRF